MEGSLGNIYPPLLAEVGWGLPPLPWRRVCLLEETKREKGSFGHWGDVFIFIYKAEQVNLGPHGNSQEQTARNRFDQ